MNRIEINLLTEGWVDLRAQSTGNNLMVDYDCINAMVSMQSEGKIEWLQELGPIVKQSQLTMTIKLIYDLLYC